jgi:hypothetical protein
MPGIFEGIDDLIDQSLGVLHIGTKAPHYKNKSAALKLDRKPYSFDAHVLFEKIGARMQKNWSNAHDLNPRSASIQNWRWEKKLYISENNLSPEKCVEKEIAAFGGEDWVNQVPTASGLLDGSSEKHCNIDLVHRISPEEFEFIELKYECDTPLYAAFEILKYGLLYVFSRRCAEQLGYSADSKPMLGARIVHLKVVAPFSYYSYFRPDWLQKEANRALGCVSLDGYQMDFHCEYMAWPTEGNACVSVASRKPM